MITDVVVLNGRLSPQATEIAAAKQQADLMAAHYHRLIAKRVPASVAGRLTAVWWQAAEPEE